MWTLHRHLNKSNIIDWLHFLPKYYFFIILYDKYSFESQNYFIAILVYIDLLVEMIYFSCSI